MAHAPFQCIFCKSTTASFASREHIVPESLGNAEHILPPGVVCDGCNNYFARKIEGPLLGTDFMMQARHRNGISSKRKRVPVQNMLSFPDALPLEMGMARDGSRYLSAADESDNDRFVNRLFTSNRLTAIFPVPEKPQQRLFSRFLLVMGLEYLADRMLPVDCGIVTDHINNSALDESRRYARFNEGVADWPYHECQIYPEGKPLLDSETGLPYDVPHEFTLLYTPKQEMYFVIALFGTQYTINLGGPELEGFCDWLVENDNASPLYPTGT